MFYGYLPMILDGLRVTLSVASVSLGVACVFGLLGALAKLSHSPVLRGTATVYTTVVRSLAGPASDADGVLRRADPAQSSR